MRFEALRETLLKGGIAPWRVKRYLAELRDHHEDLTANQIAAGYEPEEAALRAQVLLGSEAELAEGWLNQPRLKSFTARAPWAAFIVMPPALVLIAFVIPTVTLVGIAKAHGMLMHNGVSAPIWFQNMAAIMTWASNLLLGPALAILMIVTAHRQRLSSKWPLIGIALVALIAMRLQVQFPAPGQHGGSISLSAFFPIGSDSHALYRAHGPLMLAQLLLTLSPLLWLGFARKSYAGPDAA